MSRGILGDNRSSSDCFRAMSGRSRQLITDEPVEFEK